MTDKELKEIRQKISCPQLGDECYGEWGILTKDQRFTIKRMLDYIATQEAEIERLQKAIKVQDIMIDQHDYYLKKAKAEAYKECIEQVKAYYRETRFAYDAECLCEELDDLLKEKVGAEDERTN